MKPILSIPLLLIYYSAAITQTLHHLPFASTGNRIELTVANTSGMPIADVRVHLEHAPAWLHFVSPEQTLGALNANAESTALFTFTVDRSAPVNQEHRLQFRISTSDGQSRTKEIAIIVDAPKRFELFQNYPNPFNPTTVISYQLATPSHVRLTIFNLLGQEVATLVDGEQLAGYHQATFDARMLASGLYFYQLVSATPDGARKVSRRIMALVK